MSDEAKPSPNDAAAPSTEGASSAPSGEASGGLAYEQARLAYNIILSLLEHTRVTQDLVALMAQVIGEETQDALVNTPHWAAYMDSRRALERTREDVEKFAQVWTRLAEEIDLPHSQTTPQPPESS